MEAIMTRAKLLRKQGAISDHEFCLLCAKHALLSYALVDGAAESKGLIRLTDVAFKQKSRFEIHWLAGKTFVQMVDFGGMDFLKKLDELHRQAICMEIRWFFNRCDRYRMVALTWMMGAPTLEPRLPKDIVLMIAKMVYDERQLDDGRELWTMEDVMRRLHRK